MAGYPAMGGMMGQMVGGNVGASTGLGGDVSLETLLEQMSPEELAQYLDLSGIDLESLIGGSAIGQARADLEQEAPQGLKVGGTYVAANPLQHLAYGLRQAKARKALEGAQAGLGGLPGKQRGGIGAIIAAILRKKNPAEEEPTLLNWPDEE